MCSKIVQKPGNSLGGRATTNWHLRILHTILINNIVNGFATVEENGQRIPHSLGEGLNVGSWMEDKMKRMTRSRATTLSGRNWPSTEHLLRDVRNGHFRQRRERSGRPRRPVLRESQNLDHLAEVAVNNLQQGEFAWTGIPRCSAEGDSEEDNYL